MPQKLSLPQLRLHKSKEPLPDQDLTKNDVTVSVDSLSTLASNDSLWIDQAPEENCGYTVNRLRRLCKLNKAVWKDDPELVKVAIASLKKHMYIDYFGQDCRTALHFACARCHEVNVRLICESGANPNLAELDGATPMHKAVESGCSKGVNHLLKIGGDPNLVDKLGRTPLHIAAKTGDIASALLLLQWKAFIDAIEKNGMTPLHVATVRNHLKFASNLVTNGSNIDCQDGLGKTCLMFASAVGNTRFVQLFLEKKANLTFTDNQGLNALAFAKSKNHQDCVNLLEEYEKKELESRATLVQTKPLVQLSECSLGEPAANKDEYVSLSQNDNSMDVNSWAISSSDTGVTQDQRDEETYCPTQNAKLQVRLQKNYRELQKSKVESQELKYKLDQTRELDVLGGFEACHERQVKYRKLEVDHRSLAVSHQQVKEELSEISGCLQGERESRIFQERLYREQTKMCDLLRAEFTKAQESKNEFSNKLELSETSRQDLKTRVCDLSNTNSQLQEELTTMQQRAKDAESKLECVSQILKEKTDLQVQIEDNLQKSQYQFESHLNDLKEKVEFLTNALDVESCKRSEVEQQTSNLQSKLESVTVEFHIVIKQNEDKECMLTQLVDELRQEKAVKEKEADLTKELNSQQINNTESPEAKLQALENELKVTNTLLHEHTNHITGLQHQTRMSSLEDTLQSERECESKMESQLCVFNENVSSLQAEITSLRQQLVSAENGIEERARTKQEMQERLESVQTARNEDQEKECSPIKKGSLLKSVRTRLCKFFPRSHKHRQVASEE